MDDEKKLFSTGGEGFPTREDKDRAATEAVPRLLALGLTQQQIGLLNRGGAYFALNQVADILEGESSEDDMDKELAAELKEKIARVTELQSQNAGGEKDAEILALLKTFF